MSYSHTILKCFEMKFSVQVGFSKSFYRSRIFEGISLLVILDLFKVLNYNYRVAFVSLVKTQEKEMK